MRTTRRSSSNIPQGSILLNGELVSEETLQKRAEPVKKKGKPWWMQIATQHYLWIWLLGAGGLGALVSPHFKAIDPYAPWLNELIHHSVTDQRDVEYQEFKFRQSQENFARVRDACTAFALDKCGALPAVEPALNDMAARVYYLENAWQTVAYRAGVDPECESQGSSIYGRATQYVEDERYLITMVKSSDLQSEARRTGFQQKLAQFEPVEKTNIHDLNFWPDSCPVLTRH
jgi:hypothetical protein